MSLSKGRGSAGAQQVFRERLAERALSRSSSLVARRREGALPLSFAQERLWFLEQLGLVGPAYNIVMALRLDGKGNADALAASLTDLVQRHEALRTRYEAVDGIPRQVVGAGTDVGLAQVDLTAVPPSERDARVERLLHGELDRPFNLERGPVFRSTLVTLGARSHVLVMAMHHIASDGWSSGVLIRDLAAFYAARVAGGALPAPLSCQYADYALWQRERLEGVLLETQLAYWRRALSGAPPQLNLPLDKPRPAEASFAGDIVRFAIDAPTRLALQALARGEEATMYMLLLAAYQTLLSRWTGQTDILVGSPIAGRTHPALEPMVGFFVNTLVMRGDLSESPSFRTLLRQVKDTALGAYAHQELPFEKLVAELQPHRDLSQTPIIQTVFALHSDNFEVTNFPSLVATELKASQGSAKFDLSLHVRETAQGLKAGIEYATDLFQRGTIEALADQYATLLRSIVADPDERVSRLSLLSEGAARALEPLSAARDKGFEPSCLIHERVAAQAARAPEAIALACGEERLTYGALEARSNRLAHRLRAAGIGPDRLVGLCAERSPAMVIGMLGILKAGGAYVPLDPHYPRERLAFMLKDTAASVLVTESALIGTLPPSAAQIVLLDELDGNADPGSPDSGVAQHHLAYVIYTSGSTGQPKGVLVSHANIARLLLVTEREFNLHITDTWTLFHSFAFDFSVWEVFGSLTSGARLVIVPLEIAQSPEEFFKLLQKEQVTVLNQTPSVFLRLSQVASEQPRLGALRLVIFGGEALAPRALRKWTDLYGWDSPALVNMYGITETTVHVTCRRLKAEDEMSATWSPIGTPLADLELHVMDEALQPVPHGIVGEICIGGAGVTFGYLNREELTTERFVTHPVAGKRDGRLYRSGDLARRRNDEVEYLGRLDNQMKVRGFRIELGEIEAVLMSEPSVTAAVVRPIGENDGRRLVAWVRSDAAIEDFNSRFRNWAAKRMPQFMVPTQFVPISELPLTRNGKIDEKRLPVPELTTRPAACLPKPPGSEAEAGMIKIWEEVLNLSPIGVLDNYFAIGGDSVRALQIVRNGRERGFAMSVADLFRHQTVRSLVASFKEDRPSLAYVQDVVLASLTVPSFANDRRFADAYPLTAMQRLMVEEYQRSARSGHGVYHAQQALRIRDPQASPEALEEALHLLTKVHPVLRTRFLRHKEEIVQVVAHSAPAEFQLLNRANSKPEMNDLFLRRLMKEDRHAPFETDGTTPLVRFQAVRRTPDELDLVMSVHHAIDDGWGFHSFLTDLLDLYEALRDGRGSNPAPVTNVFKEHVAIERAELAKSPEVAFWRDYASRLLPTELPPNPKDAGAEVRTESPDFSFVLPASAGNALRQVARSAGVSLKVVLLAAFRLALAESFGTSNPTIGLVANGRTDRLTDPIRSLGLFWSFVPFTTTHPACFEDEQLRSIQRELTTLEPHVLSACGTLYEPLIKGDLFFATYNFVHFHNHALAIKRVGWSVETVGSFDRFHYPINALFAASVMHEGLYVRLEIDLEKVGLIRSSAFQATLKRVLHRMIGQL